jgi:hypothetical protein
MTSPLTKAHIAGEARIRTQAVRAVTAVWLDLRSYDEADIPRFLDLALPVVEGAKRASIALTAAYIARWFGLGSLPVDTGAVLSEIRNGVSPEEVYARPFTTVWTALANGELYEDAVSNGLARLRQTAATDVQLAMRETLVAIEVKR